MAVEDMSPEDLKATLRTMTMLQANMENWTYTAVNAEYLDKKVIADALGQILSTMKPLMNAVQVSLEIEALEKLDPFDLL
jgi:hypothetical protein